MDTMRTGRVVAPYELMATTSAYNDWNILYTHENTVTYTHFYRYLIGCLP